MDGPILYESHMHTPLCKHAVGEPEEYAQIAYNRGLKGIIVTCHNPAPGGWGAGVRMKMEEFDSYQELVQRARGAWQGKIDVRLGLETDFVPGMESWIRELHSRAEFHHILGSVHPQLADYQKTFFKGDWFEFQKLYFEHLAMAAESGLFDTIAHPDIVKIAKPDQWQLERLKSHICCVLDRIAATGICMELNTSGLYKSISEMNPGIWYLHQMCERKIPVVIGADAHDPKRVADHYEEALQQLEEVGYRKINFFLNRKRQEVEIFRARESLKNEIKKK